MNPPQVKGGTDSDKPDKPERGKPDKSVSGQGDANSILITKQNTQSIMKPLSENELMPSSRSISSNELVIYFCSLHCQNRNKVSHPISTVIGESSSLITLLD